MYTVAQTFGYHSQKFIHVKMSVQAHSTEAKISNILKLRKVMNGSATDSQGCIRTSYGDPGTGTFHQMWVTTRDTVCNVKGV